MSKQQFEKFINQPIKGAKKKEQLRQEKKNAKKEREAYFIEKKRQARAAKKLQMEGRKAEETAKEHKKFEKKGQPGKTGPKEKFPPKDKFSSKDNFASKEKFSPKEKSASNDKFPSNKEDGQQPVFGKRDQEATKKTFPPKEKTHNSESKPGHVTRKESKKDFKAGKKVEFDKKPRETDRGLPFKRKELKKAEPETITETVKPKIKVQKAGGNQMPLNKYIAHGGICSRRDAGELVKSGKVKVNGEVETNPAYKVQENDVVIANGKKVFPQQNLVYVLLNKPKDYITTAEDPQGRKTVMDIVKTATTDRIYPVGRLDRNTSGVLLLTNDGELAQQLTHPSFEVRKIYEAKLDRPLTKADFDSLLSGIKLEDGMVVADSVAYADNKDKSVIGIEIHSGRNRIVRRMFEHLGYDVKGLDRVMFANLTKKNVDRGKWRLLTEKEVRLLKFFNKSKR